MKLNKIVTTSGLSSCCELLYYKDEYALDAIDSEDISSEGIYKLKQCLDLTVVRLIFNNGGTVFGEEQYCREALELQVMLCIFFVVTICTEPANLLTGVCKFLWVSIMYSSIHSS